MRQKKPQGNFEKSQLQVDVRVFVCTSVSLSHAAARSTMVDISWRALFIKVEMASRSHSLMSVTTWSTQTHTEHILMILFQLVL